MHAETRGGAVRGLPRRSAAPPSVASEEISSRELNLPRRGDGGKGERVAGAAELGARSAARDAVGEAALDARVEQVEHVRPELQLAAPRRHSIGRARAQEKGARQALAV